MVFGEHLSFAMLSREQLEKIQVPEAELGVTLIVYDE